MPAAAEPKKAAASRPTKAVAKKRVARPRRKAVKKAVPETVDSEIVQASTDRGSSSSRPTSSRQIEGLAVITLALLFGLIGLAVHVLWIVSIVLMAMQFGLIASALGNGRGRSVISEVAEEVVTVVEEIKSGSSGRDDPETQLEEAAK